MQKPTQTLILKIVIWLIKILQGKYVKKMLYNMFMSLFSKFI
jgi:hypothetical protein